MRAYLKIFGEGGTKPEFEVYDAGMINNLAFLIRRGWMKPPVYIQFVFGILGGMGAAIENLVFLHDSAVRLLGGSNFVWSVCATGRFEMPMITHALLMGGNARVGLEDALSLSHGVLAKSNAELVAKAIRIVREFDIEAATPAEARKMLGTEGIGPVGY